MSDRSIFSELLDVRRLIEDNRKTLYSLQADHSDIPARIQKCIHDKEIVIKSLEIYQDVLERTIDAQSRREKNCSHNETSDKKEVASNDRRTLRSSSEYRSKQSDEHGGQDDNA